MTDLALLPATELVSLYRAGKASPVEAAKAAYANIAKHNDTYNAFCMLDEDDALESARVSEERWKRGEPLSAVDGVLTSVKDLLLVKGWPTLRGSRTIPMDQDWETPGDAPAVARMKEAGAVLLGKTTTPEYGWKGVTDSPLTGVTGNPWDPTKTPGGSSGGAAAACALGMGTLHFGTDAGGSIRIPCGFSGIFGIKGTFGRVGAWPASPFGTLANVGPMTRTVSDAALMMNVIAQPDRRDWLGLPAYPEDFTADLEAGVEGLRIAYSPNLGGRPVDEGIAALVDRAVQWFDEQGAIIEPAEPDVSDALEIFMAHWFGIASAAFKDLPEDKKKLMDPGLQRVIALGADYSLPKFVEADFARRALGERVNAFFADYDLLMLPTLPITAFETGRNSPTADAVEDWINWTPFSYPFNLSRNPACSVPCGFVGGLPAGLQIVGDHMADSLVLRAARAYEAAHPIKLPEVAG